LRALARNDECQAGPRDSVTTTLSLGHSARRGSRKHKNKSHKKIRRRFRRLVFKPDLPPAYFFSAG
jgi:hypothetical protein